MVLEEKLKGQNNRLDLLKFIAAILVIFSHSFALVGKAEEEWLYQLTLGQIDFGGLSVGIFLFSSGLLVSKSLMKTEDMSFKDFMKKRCIRIFPPLIVTVVLTTFLLGPLLTTLDLKEYFTNTMSYKYLLNSILVLQHDLPGVFQGNIAMSTVNGALWTLPVEFLFYIGCYIIKKLGLYSKKGMRITFPIVMIIWIIICIVEKNNVFVRILRVGMFFFMGVFCYVYKDELKLNVKYAILSILLLVISIFLKILNPVIVLAFPYFLLVLLWGGKKEDRHIKKIAVLGKYSYTIYLCGFPLQQMLIQLYGGDMNNYVNFIEAILLSIVIGKIIYVIGEKPFITKNNKIK